MSLLPLRGEVDRTPESPRVLDLDDEHTDAALSALSSETARDVLQALYERPRTPPELREEVGTTLQNVHYHVDNLESADLISPAGTSYSEKGNEMTVYAPASRAVVLFAGEDHDRSRLRSVLGRVLGALAILAGASALLGWLLSSLTSPGGLLGYGASSGKAGDAAASGGSDVAVATNVTYDGASEPARIAGEAAAQPFDPAVAFFLGGAFVLAMVLAWGYWRRR